MSSPLNKYARGHCVFNWILDRLFWVQESPQWFTRASLVIWFTCVVLAYRGHTGTLKLNKLINSPEQNQFGDQVSFHKNYRLKRSSSWFRTFPDTTDVQRQTSWQGFAFSIGQICSKLCYLIIKGKSALGVKHFNIRRLNRMRRWSDWRSSIVWCKLVACSAMSCYIFANFYKESRCRENYPYSQKIFQLNFKGFLEISCWWIDFSKNLGQNETGWAIRAPN